MEHQEDLRPPTVAELLNTLFDRHRQPNGKPYSNEDVASAIRAQGTDITQSYIWQLRHGVRADPRGSHLKALACFFGVPAGYFLDVETYRTVERKHNGISDPREAAAMLRKVNELSPQIQAVLDELIDEVRQLDK